MTTNFRTGGHSTNVTVLFQFWSRRFRKLGCWQESPNFNQKAFSYFFGQIYTHYFNYKIHLVKPHHYLILHTAIVVCHPDPVSPQTKPPTVSCDARTLNTKIFRTVAAASSAVLHWKSKLH
jgi:hypothetical protein